MSSAPASGGRRPEPEVSIVVVTYNSAETIEACLRSIEVSGPSAEVVVVDNNSADSTVALVQQRFPGLRLLANTRNEGFGRACNRGWRATRAPFVMLLNPDTELRPGALAALGKFIESRPRAALVGPRILNTDGTLQHSCFRFPRLRMVLTGFFGLIPLDSPENGRYTSADYECAHQVEHLLGACLLVRRSATETVGLFDEGFYMYFEETDWCYRLREAGWQAWYTPEAEVVHRGAHSTAREPEKMSAAFYRSQTRFYRKHYDLRRCLGLKAVSVLGIGYWTARTARGVLRGRVSHATLRRRLASYWAILWA